MSSLVSSYILPVRSACTAVSKTVVVPAYLLFSLNRNSVRPILGQTAMDDNAKDFKIDFYSLLNNVHQQKNTTKDFLRH